MNLTHSICKFTVANEWTFISLSVWDSNDWMNHTGWAHTKFTFILNFGFTPGFRHRPKKFISALKRVDCVKPCVTQFSIAQLSSAQLSTTLCLANKDKLLIWLFFSWFGWNLLTIKLSNYYCLFNHPNQTSRQCLDHCSSPSSDYSMEYTIWNVDFSTGMCT